TRQASDARPGIGAVDGVRVKIDGNLKRRRRYHICAKRVSYRWPKQLRILCRHTQTGISRRRIVCGREEFVVYIVEAVPGANRGLSIAPGIPRNTDVRGKRLPITPVKATPAIPSRKVDRRVAQ